MTEEDLKQPTVRHRIAIVGGDDRVLGAEWSRQYDIRHIKCDDTDRLRTMVQTGSVAAIVVLTKWTSSSALSAVRKFHGQVPVRYFDGSINSLVVSIDGLLRDLLPRRPLLTVPPPSQRAFNPPRIAVVPPPEEPAGVEPPAPPVAPAPEPMPDAATVDVTARYQPSPKDKRGWPDEHVTKVVAIAESGLVDALLFCREVARRTGVYRMPGGLQQRLRPLSAICKIPPELLTNLERRARQLSKAKVALMAHEAKVMRNGGGSAVFGDWVSIATATRLVGDVISRLDSLQMFDDTETACHVFRTSDVLRLRDELMARQGGRPLTKESLPPPPRTSAEDVAANVIRIATERPGIAKGELSRCSGATRDRFEKIFDQLVAEKKLVTAPHPTKKGVLYVGPPGWTYTAPVMPPRRAPSPAAEAPRVDSSLTAEIYRAIRAKEISPEEGARMMRELRG